jgi:hypothetical protein
VITTREPAIRQALVERPDLTDRQIAKLLDIRLWSKVCLVREIMAAEASPPPPWACASCGAAETPAISDPTRCEACVRATNAPPAPAPDVPAASDLAPRQPVIVANPTAICANCGREGTPAPDHLEWCKACHAGGASVRARWPAPPRSPGVDLALALLNETDNPFIAERLRRHYLRARAADYGILEVRHGDV